MLHPGSPGPAAAAADTAEAPAQTASVSSSDKDNTETLREAVEKKADAPPLATGVALEGGEAGAGAGAGLVEVEGLTKRRSACDNCSLKKIRVSRGFPPFFFWCAGERQEHVDCAHHLFLGGDGLNSPLCSRLLARCALAPPRLHRAHPETRGWLADRL